MSNTKHTPGPWTAMLKPAPSMTDHGWRAMAMCGSRWMVAAPYSVAFQCWDSEANARLIAAAPQLLEVLRELVSLEADGKHADESAIEVWERAAAFIAKATGE